VRRGLTSLARADPWGALSAPTRYRPRSPLPCASAHGRPDGVARHRRPLRRAGRAHALARRRAQSSSSSIAPWPWRPAAGLELVDQLLTEPACAATTCCRASAAATCWPGWAARTSAGRVPARGVPGEERARTGAAPGTRRRGRPSGDRRCAGRSHLRRSFRELADDPRVRAAILTGTGKFFSFGFDIPKFLGYSKDAFANYLGRFTGLYRELYSFWVGARRTQEILYGGKLYSAEEAQALGLVDLVVSEDRLPDAARDLARRYAAQDPAAFRSIKELLRRPVIENMCARERQSIREFVDIWYSERTWKQLQQIEIR
jgi:hypothetical protein